MSFDAKSQDSKGFCCFAVLSFMMFAAAVLSMKPRLTMPACKKLMQHGFSATCMFAAYYRFNFEMRSQNSNYSIFNKLKTKMIWLSMFPSLSLSQKVEQIYNLQYWYIIQMQAYCTQQHELAIIVILNQHFVHAEIFVTKQVVQYASSK